MYRRHKASLTMKSDDIAAKKRLLLTLKYLPSYKKKFPQYDDMLNYKYGLLEAIYNEDDLIFNDRDFAEKKLGRKLSVKEDLPKELHPGQAASIIVDGEKVGIIGKIHPLIIMSK